MSSIYDLIQAWSSEGGGEGDPVSSVGDIETYLDGLIGEFATLHTDPATLPTLSEERPNQGPFTSVQDLVQYLGSGQLLIEDEFGNPVVNPIVEVVKRYSAALESDVWDVYISPSP
jgi:hypothetical protein